MNLLSDKGVSAGFLGLLAALLVGAGEFFLHFDALGRFGGVLPYEFMQGIDAPRTTFGHFLGVLAAPLYIVGFWHLMKVLEPANRFMAKLAFAVMSYGIIIGSVWIGSRADISAFVNSADVVNKASLISLYELRYENLLQVTHLSVLVFSMLFAGLILTGKTLLPKWMALLNPIVLIAVSFAIWLAAPDVGIYLMPIALNVAFFILFAFSTYFSIQHGRKANV